MKSNKKYITAWALLGLSIVGLAACDKTGTSSESTNTGGSGSGNSSDSTLTIPEPPIVSNVRRIEVTLKTDDIPSGSTFFDGCQPSVVYTDDDTGEEEEVYSRYNMTSYTIYDAETAEVYEPDDALPAGHYICDVYYQNFYIVGDRVEFDVTEATPIEAEEGKGFQTYTTEDLADYHIQNFDSIETLGGHGMPSNGDVDILVVPVQFSNAAAQFKNPDEVKTCLEEAFFAETGETPWESLSSYYYKSSYGKLNIGGEVTPIYTYPVDDTTIDSSNIGVSTTIATQAVNWLKTEHGYDMSKYDLDKDGYIDGIQIVYATSQTTPGMSGTGDASSSDLWWNFTTNASGSSNVRSPNARRIFWSRYDYVTNTYYSSSEYNGGYYEGKRVDPHTIIHETGHMMGAPDYYSYDRTEGPAGQVDMMDNNVGDHNAYTKMMFNWVAPRVVDGSAKNFTITLKSYTETGDFLLVKPTSDPWNETPYDEYLMLQYYTPTGLNEMDHEGYAEWQQESASGGSNTYGHGGTYEHPGLQIYHVDTRAASYVTPIDENGQATGEAVFDYTDTPRSDEYADRDAGFKEGEAHRIHDNTPSRSHNPDGTTRNAPTELQAVFPSRVNSTGTSSYYSLFGLMTNLYGLESYRETGDETTKDGYYGGDTFSVYQARDYFTNGYFFNDGSRFDWVIQVVEQTDDTITLHFVNTTVAE